MSVPEPAPTSAALSPPPPPPICDDDADAHTTEVIDLDGFDMDETETDDADPLPAVPNDTPEPHEDDLAAPPLTARPRVSPTPSGVVIEALSTLPVSPSSLSTTPVPPPSSAPSAPSTAAGSTPSVIPRRPTKAVVQAALKTISAPKTTLRGAETSSTKVQSKGDPEAAPSAWMVCISCSVQLDVTAKFCGECGCSVGAASLTDLLPPPPMDIDDLPPPPPPSLEDILEDLPPPPMSPIKPTVASRRVVQPPPPPPMPTAITLASTTSERSLVELINQRSLRKAPMVTPKRNSRAALLESLGLAGQGRARLKKINNMNRNSAARASSMEVAIATALDNRRSAVSDKRDSTMSDQNDDDWE
jgi:hypothetical protein